MRCSDARTLPFSSLLRPDRLRDLGVALLRSCYGFERLSHQCAGAACPAPTAITTRARILLALDQSTSSQSVPAPSAKLTVGARGSQGRRVFLALSCARRRLRRRGMRYAVRRCAVP
ncbi:hypothetical protein BD626DRAFT_489061 [Schizophyllum amplum]|uniref:Uncharacterized protein n=1 Tax=Schizophyllum amplum TaxID=97359 RepID=A0A550CL63_9AGAR|nr:hypothetical protein BD626DRAFT_489061 [Auriculariopsis ampla]